MKKIIVALLVLCNSFVFAQEVNEKVTKKQNIFLDISGGFGGRLGKTKGSNNLEKRHAQNLKTGFSYDVSLYIRLAEDKNSFIGLKYNSFQKRSVMNGVYVTAPNGQEGYGEFSDDIAISYYGLSYLYSKENSKGAFNFDFGLGYVNYCDKAVYLNDYKIKGGTLGFYTSGSYYFKVTDYIMLGPKIGVLLGSLSSIKVDGAGFHDEIELDGNEKESLSRIDLSFGARIKF